MAAVSEDPVAKALADEITDLKSQAANLRRQLKIQTSTILSNKVTRSSLRKPSSSLSRRNASSLHLERAAEQHEAHVQRCVHRIANSVTAFKVQDPDPNAVDGAHVLGLRFEVMSRGQFLKPYYAMLNRPYPGSSFLRVHRHTLPQAVPLPGLAARHLPEPRPGSEVLPQQDLERFVRALRREIMRYHNRLGIAADLRRGLGLQEKDGMEPDSAGISEIGIADIEGKQIKITWADQRSGRLVMDDDGKVLKLMIFGQHGRDWETTKELIGEWDRIEDVAQKLQDLSKG